MRLRYFTPSLPLRDLLTAHAIADRVEVPQFVDMPAMLPNLHIRLGGSTGYSLAGGPPMDAPPVALIGPTMSSYRIFVAPGLLVLGAGLLPAGWARLIGVPAHELGDQVIDAGCIFGDSAVDRLLDQLHAIPGEAAMRHCVERFLMQSARRLPGRSDPVAAAVDRWLERSPGLDLCDLRAMLAVGDRQMRRIVTETHGARPKALAVKYRSLRAAALLATRGPPAMDRAIEPFADQAHFIREFRRFTGWTPHAFSTDPHNTVAHTLAGRRRAGVLRPLSLWS